MLQAVVGVVRYVSTGLDRAQTSSISSRRRRVIYNQGEVILENFMALYFPNLIRFSTRGEERTRNM